MNYWPAVLEFERVRCNLCGADDTRPVLLGTDKAYHIAGSFQLVRCNCCGLVYQNPRPTPASLAATYPDDYGPHCVSKALRVPASRSERWKEQIKDGLADQFFFAGTQPPKALLRLALLPFYLYVRSLALIPYPPAHPDARRALDIGCGTGDYLRELALKGWELHGVEPSPAAAARALAATGAAIVCDAFRPGLYPACYFDLISMWHVLEHVPDPRACVVEVYRLLRPGGYFIVGLPNIASLEFAILLNDWQPLDLPRHLYHFSPRTLRRLLSLARLQPRRMVFHIAPLNLEASLSQRAGRPWIEGGRLDPRVTRQRLWPLSFLLAHLHTSGVFTLIARKACV